MKVAICIATYRRPVMLGALLDSIATLTFASSAPEIVIVVVDNDADETAASVIASRRGGLPWAIIAGVEPTRNIALARNRGVALALENGADWIAFVDDDECVSNGWLAELLRVQAVRGAEIVGGTAVNRYPDGTPEWIVANQLPARTRRPTGAASSVAETSNVLVARRVVDILPTRFDERFGRSGGSDAHFFLRARRAGASIVWADEAIVYETFLPSRTTVRWLLMRAFRSGNTAVLVARDVLPLWQWLPARVAAIGYRVARGLVLLPGLVRGRAGLVGSFENFAIAAGAVAAMVGYRYMEYDRSHGE